MALDNARQLSHRGSCIFRQPSRARGMRSYVYGLREIHPVPYPKIKCVIIWMNFNRDPNEKFCINCVGRPSGSNGRPIATEAAPTSRTLESTNVDILPEEETTQRYSSNRVKDLRSCSTSASSCSFFRTQKICLQKMTVGDRLSFALSHRIA